MNEDKFIELLKKHFPTREEWLLEKASNMQHQQEASHFIREAIAEFGQINFKLDELKSSAKTLDKILEQYPIERIAHLEKHTKVPPFELAMKD